MSGVKHSSYTQSGATRARTEALQQLRERQSRSSTLEHRLNGLLSQLSPGLSSSLGIPLRDHPCLTLLRQSHTRLSNLGTTTVAIADIRAVIATLDGVLAKSSAEVQKAEQRVGIARQSLRTQQATLESYQARFAANQELLKRRVPEEVAALQKQIAKVQTSLQEELLTVAEREISSLQNELKRTISEAEKRESEALRMASAGRFFSARRSLESNAQTIENRLHLASAGLKTAFDSEVTTAQDWLDKAKSQLQKSATVPETSSAEAFENHFNNLAPVLKTGESVVTALEDALTIRAAQWREQLSTELAHLDSLWKTQNETLYLWYPENAVDAFGLNVEKLKTALSNDEFSALGASISALQTDLTSKSSHAKIQEEKHTRRLHLLNALRVVCQEMGFEETEPPAFEIQGDRGSRIRLEVNTFDKGIVTFHISLENIEATSCFNSKHCHTEYGQLSQKLRDQFGIETAFKNPEGIPIEELDSDDGAPLPKSAQSGLRAHHG